ncbi:hypothetical protein [Sorangium sp. So ce1153]|uniref:hypothetical protein n=1 Tax=Sorangium sp. So ce1153 TaxID=3133333 RepID=UPI003F5F8E5C
MPKNGIHPNVLQANQDLLERLKGSQLNGLKLDDVEPFSSQNSTLEPLAVQLMDYIVYFALNEGQTVSVDVGPKHYEWNGHMGACASSGTAMGDWFNKLPTNACLEAVSASVLARVNALDKVVVLSMRGPGSPLALHDKVPVETRYREKDGSTGEAIEIESFSRCDGGGGPASATDNCGWSARYVGQCMAQKFGETENRKVTLKLGPVQVSPSPVFVRVCAGIHGCNDGAYPEADFRKKYIEHIKSAMLKSPDYAVEFECPANGPMMDVSEADAVPEASYGYFSVMLPEKSAAFDVVPVATEELTYPAPEVDVFRYREGAFYGNIFDSTSASDAGSSKDVLFDKQYACFSKYLTVGDANIADRLCALPWSGATENCFVNVPKPCAADIPGTANSCACNESDANTGLVYASCVEGGSHWEYPITSYLNHPCDLSRSADCSSLLTWYPGRLLP